VSNRDLSTTILGKKVKVPLGVSPTGFQALAHPEGECNSAKAVENVGGIFVLSVFATRSYEDIAREAPQARRWMQFYMHKDRTLTEALIRKAEKAGFEAMVVTIDCQYVGNRRCSRRDPLNFPSHLKLPNATSHAKDTVSTLFRLHDIMDHGVTWEAIVWLKKVSQLPIILKGIQCPEDARIAADIGINAVWVSNHGGRQLDTTAPTISILPGIVAAVGGRCEVYMDGGIRRGTDVFKALALGANMVFVGRPPIYGMAVNGAAGSTKVLQILRDELDLTMALAGVDKIADINTNYVQTPTSTSRL